MLLSLPTLAPSIPSSVRTGTLGARQLKMVLCMSRLGLLTDTDLAGINAASVDAAAVLTILKAVWHRAVGDVYDYRLSSVVATLFFPSQGELDVYEGDADTLFAGVCYNANTPTWIAGGKVFEALEATRKGLGKTTICELDSVLWRFGFPHTIGGVLEMCRHVEWMGEDNETLMLEEYGDEVNPEDVVRFSDVVEGIPEWAYKPTPEIKHLTVAQLESQAKRLGKKPLGKLVAVIAQLKQLTDARPLFSDMEEQEYEALEPPIIIGWNAPEQFDQYIDNFHHYQMQGESAPWVGAIRFEITEQGILEAIAHIRHTGLVLKALDEAVILIRELNEQ